jgi:hypothetical protein
MRKLYTFLLSALISLTINAQPGNTCTSPVLIGSSGCSGLQTVTGLEMYFAVSATASSHYFQLLNTDTLNGYITQLSLYGNACNTSPLFTANLSSNYKGELGLLAHSLSPGQTYILKAERTATNPANAAIVLCRQTWNYSPLSVCTVPCNLLCNGDFENFTQGASFDPINCIGANQFDDCLSQHCWAKLGAGNNTATTPDYHNAQYASCVSAPSIPHSCFGNAGLAANFTTWREYIMQTFTFPAPGIYQISYYLRRSQVTTASTNFGFLLTQTTPNSTNFFYNTTPTFSTAVPPGNNFYQQITTTVNITNVSSAYSIVFGVFDANKNCPGEYFMLDDVVIAPIAPTVNYVSQICSGSPFAISASGGTPPYNWTCTPALAGFPTTGSTIFINSPIPAGSYTITLSTTTSLGCTSTNYPLNVLQSPSASISPSSPQNICSPGSVQLTTSAGNYTYQWYQSSTSAYNGTAIPGAINSAFTASATGFYYVVVSNPLNGCTSVSNIVQVTVHPTPSAGILGVVDEKCAAANNGTILAGATGGTQPYSFVWSTTPVQTTATANNLNAGTYSVTVTDVNGCTSTAQATVGTSPALAAPILTSDAPSGNLCQSQLVTYTVTNYDPNLQYTFTTSLPPSAVTQLAAATWEVDWGSTCQSVRFTVTASNGTVACDVSTMLETGACCPCNLNPADAFMGGYAGSRTVFDLYNTYSATGIITNPSPGVYDYNNPNGTLYINGVFLIPNAITFNIINSDVQFGSGASIFVPGTTNSRLNVTGSHLHAGCNDMWDGMRVTGGGEINITNSLIEDAEKAVYSAFGAAYTITDAVFNKNYIGVELDTYGGDHPGVMTNTVFTCRQLPAGANVALLKGAQTFTDFIQEYPVATYTGTTLLNPRSGQRSYIGVHIRNNGSAVVAPSSALVTSFTAARIGVSTGYNDLNVFDNLDYGVYAYYSNVIVENNAFQYITSPQIINPNTPNTGAGVYGITFSEPGDVWVIRVGGSSGGQTNTFWNCGRGVDLNGYYDTEVSTNLFHSAQVYSPVPLNTGYGLYGIFLKSGNSRRMDVQLNEVANIRNAIAVFADAIPASSGQYYKFIGLGTISNNRIAAQPSFGSPVTGAYVQLGIGIQNVIPPCSNCLTEQTVDRLYIENNVFEQVYNGIRLMNWNKYPRIADNQIGLKYLAPQPAQPNPQQGIRIMNTTTPVVYRNTIIGDVQCLTKTNVRGIYGTRSASGIWQCNYVQNVGQCLVFEGNCGGAKVFTNQMYDSQDGLVLLNNGIIGAQGSLPSSTSIGAVCDNYWFGPFSHADTYTDQTFAPDTHSPLYIRNSSAPGYIPLVNLSTGFPTLDSYDAPGAIILTNPPTPDWNCNEPAPIAEQGGGDKKEQVKLMEQIAQDELELSGYVNAGQWMDKKDAYQQLLADSTLMDTSVVLQNFYADAPAESYGKVTDVNELAGANNLNAAQNAGTALPENTDAEYNHKQVVLLFAKRMNGDTLDAAELATLEQIAHTCPLYGGTAVYQAQALLCLVKDEVLYFDEDCFVPVNANRKPRKTQQGNQTAVQASVYPNPATTQLTVNCASADGIPVQLVIRDIAGRVVLTQQLNPAAHLHTVNIEALAQGTYTLSLSNGEILLLNQSVVKSK